MRHTLIIIVLLLVVGSGMAIYRTSSQIDNKVLDATNNAKRVIMAGGDSTQTDSINAIAVDIDDIRIEQDLQGDSIVAIAVDIDDIRIEQDLQGDSIDAIAVDIDDIRIEQAVHGDTLDAIAIYNKGIWDSLASVAVIQAEALDSISAATLDIDSMLITWENLSPRILADTMEYVSVLDSIWVGGDGDTVTTSTFATNYHTRYSLFVDAQDLDEGTDSVDYQIEAIYSLDDIEYTNTGDSVGYISAASDWELFDITLKPAPYTAITLVPSADTGDSVGVFRAYIVKHD